MAVYWDINWVLSYYIHDELQLQTDIIALCISYHVQMFDIAFSAVSILSIDNSSVYIQYTYYYFSMLVISSTKN